MGKVTATARRSRVWLALDFAVARVDPLVVRGLRLDPSMEVTYFIKAGPFVKIGRTRNFGDRVKVLRTALPYEIEILGLDASAELERLAHAFFAPLRVRGEWFRFEGALEKFLSRA